MVIDSLPNKYGYDVKCEKNKCICKKIRNIKKSNYMLQIKS